MKRPNMGLEMLLRTRDAMQLPVRESVYGKQPSGSDPATMRAASMQFLRKSLVSLGLICFIAVQSWSAEQVFSEYVIKAAFIYNFVLFVNWSAEAFERPDSPIVICALGDDSIGPLRSPICTSRSARSVWQPRSRDAAAPGRSARRRL